MQLTFNESDKSSGSASDLAQSITQPLCGTTDRWSSTARNLAQSLAGLALNVLRGLGCLLSGGGLESPGRRSDDGLSRLSEERLDAARRGRHCH